MKEKSGPLRSDFSEFMGDAAPAFALAEMQSTGSNYAVIFDSEGLPSGLATLEDVRRAARAGVQKLLHPAAAIPPAIVAPEDADAVKMASDPTVTLLEFGAHGAIVMSGRMVRGILAAPSIVEALGMSGAAPTAGRPMGPETHLGDNQLGGTMDVPVARLVCRQCGYVNQVDSLDPDRLPECSSPTPPKHTLKVN